jgi:hypothetical protein
MTRSLNLTPSTAHQIFCPRHLAKNAGVHVTCQTLLSDSTQTGKCRQRSAEPANTKFHEYSFSGSPVAANPQTLNLHSCKLRLLMCQKKLQLEQIQIHPLNTEQGHAQTVRQTCVWNCGICCCVRLCLKAGPQQQVMLLWDTLGTRKRI